MASTRSNAASNARTRGAAVARITTAGNTHLRELTALPRSAADHVDTRLARVPIDN
jgi:hypothetical protein